MKTRHSCIIVEDQAPAQRVLQRYIEDLGGLQLQGTFRDPVTAMEFLQSQETDLIFLDIHLPKISGLDFLKSLINPPAIILTTAFSEYAVQSYEYNVLDYLVKPISFPRFVKAVSKLKHEDAADSASQHQNTDFFIKSGYEYIRINSKDILFIRSDMDYTEIHLAGKQHLTQESLSYWESKLSNLGFFRIHKSHLVNTVKIQKVAGNMVHLEQDISLPIGRAYKESFIEGFVK